MEDRTVIVIVGEHFAAWASPTNALRCPAPAMGIGFLDIGA